MPEQKYQELVRRLSSHIPREHLIQDPLRSFVYGTDASFYRLVPKVVVRVRTEAEVSRVVKACAELNIAYTFRAAGTSLSGQAVSDSVLIQLSRLWNGIRVSPDGLAAAFEPAVIGGAANAALAPFQRKIGPDPASIDSAMIGGIASNNSSGMCCGNVQDTYHTMASMRLVLADGSTLDTGSQESRREFAASHCDLLCKINALARSAKENSVLAERIRKKYRIKNTTGYSLHSLIDFTDPFDVLAHLMIGAEGTLGFISEITYNTVPDYPHRATGLLLFPNIRVACEACNNLRQASVAAAELMDRESIRSVQNKPAIPEHYRALDENAAVLLVETQADDVATLRDQVAAIHSILSATPPVGGANFTQDKAEAKKMWDARKGLIPALGYSRRVGSTILFEDIAVPPDSLADAAIDLRSSLDRFEYENASIFGHAFQGNVHFVFCQDFNDEKEVDRYEAFMEDVAEIIAGKYDGSLKAEHGTGRNVAPFVEREWGPAAFALMHEIKNAFDPAHLMNPGVILNSDPRVHVKDLKKTPESNPIIEKCTECGFCEKTCPSRHLTLTPRQRITAWREICRLAASGEDPERLASFRKSFRYQGEESCAADGLCGTICPLNIDTGKFIKEFRSENHSRTSDFFARAAGQNMGLLLGATRMVLRSANLAHRILGTPAMTNLTGAFRSLSGNRIPQWNEWLPKPAQWNSNRSHTGSRNEESLKKVVYFPSCVSRLFGASQRGPYKDSQNQRIEKLLSRGGFEVIYPGPLGHLCCGLAFSSKGYGSQGDAKRGELTDVLIQVSQGGKVPIVFDTSPCAQRMREAMGQGQDALQVCDLPEFILDHLAPRLQLRKLPKTVAVHIPCSLRKMETQDRLLKLAGACAERIFVPDSTPCCGFAGDRGFTHPELPASALVSLKGAIPKDCEVGYSTSRTCEIGVSVNSGISYQSIAYLVDEASDPRTT